MRKYLIGVAAVVAFVFSGATFATGYAKSGFVIGANAGYGYLNSPHAYLWTPAATLPYNGVLHQSRTLGALVWGASLGYGFAVSPRLVLGAMIAYQNLGRARYRSRVNYTPSARSAYYIESYRRIQQYAIAALLTGNYFLWRGLYGFGRFGVAFLNTKTKNTYNNSGWNAQQREQYEKAFNFNKTIWRMRPEVALGLGYMFLHNLSVYVMMKHIFSFVGNEESRNSVPVPTNGDNFIGHRIFAYGSTSIVGGFTYTFPCRF